MRVGPDDSDTKAIADAWAAPQPAPTAHAPWQQAAERVQAWARRESLALRDLVVVLPRHGWLAPMRAALAGTGGWQPRVETLASLTESLGPGAGGLGQGPGADASTHRLQVAEMLRAQPFGREWERRDRREFGLAVAAVVEAADLLTQGAAARPAAEREAYWAQARVALAGGADGLRAALAGLALAYAHDAGPLPVDLVSALRPSGWVIVRLGAEQSVAEAVVGQTGLPCLVLELDPPADQVFAALGRCLAPAVWVCDDREAEAQAAATVVLQALGAGAAPVALVALDRVLSRRVQAMLEAAGVEVADEAGWRLSTTRAAATLMAWLRVASPAASADDWLDWFTTSTRHDAAALEALERGWRRGRGLTARLDDPQAQGLWRRAQQELEPLRGGPARRSLSAWRQDLARSLREAGAWQALAEDEAGAGALAALRLDRAGSPAFEALSAQLSWPRATFAAWAEAELEDARYRPVLEQAQVVLTPLASAAHRGFGAVVMPGADAAGLGRIEASTGLLGESALKALGLPGRQEQRRRLRLQWLHLLAHRSVTVLRRRGDGQDPAPASPELLALDLAMREAGREGLVERAWRPWTELVAAAPRVASSPRADAAMPRSLSASQVEALFSCPYRFFGRAVLGLHDQEEIERDADKRDYGELWHAALHRFHATRTGDGDDLAALREAAGQAAAQSGVDLADLTPFLASLEAFAPRYLNWLALTEAQGWRWRDGELAAQAAPAELRPVRLRGRIDRVDHDGAGRLRLIDYKTGDPGALRRRVASQGEEVQLPFYALLLAGRGEAAASLQAAYLGLDDAKAPTLVEVDELAPRAQALERRLADILARLREGAGLPALGEGRVCEHCEMRGLCRRDDWLAWAIGDHCGEGDADAGGEA